MAEPSLPGTEKKNVFRFPCGWCSRAKRSCCRNVSQPWVMSSSQAAHSELWSIAALVTLTSVPVGTGFSVKMSPPLTTQGVWSAPSTTLGLK